MTASKQAIPHFYLTAELAVDRLLQLREEFNQLQPEDSAASLTDFLVKAAALALRDFPALNASLDGDNLVRHGEIHIGVAVAVDEACSRGDPLGRSKGVAEIAGTLRTLIARARGGPSGGYQGSTHVVEPGDVRRAGVQRHHQSARAAIWPWEPPSPCRGGGGPDPHRPPDESNPIRRPPRDRRRASARWLQISAVTSNGAFLVSNSRRWHAMSPTDDTPARPRILVADDEPDTLGLGRADAAAGFDVDTAASGTRRCNGR
jgi:hypothetical protein